MTPKISRFLLPVTTLGFLLLAAGCEHPKTNAAVSSSSDLTAKLNALDAKRQNYESSLKAMNTVRLAQELSSDSQKGKEPFNSAAYREAISRGQAQAAELKSQLAQADRTSLLALLTLRKIDPNLYHSLDPTFRVNVLVDALKNSKFFNTWGIPNLFWEDASKAILDEGQAATVPLESLLSDKRPAVNWGPAGAAIGKHYRYRVCDYAWALLHPESKIPTDPAERDHQIGL
jgi:outer membrane murein-binding lipoprotein Lpp